MDKAELIGVGGHPALALLNSTARPLVNGPTIELLGDGAALLEWLAAAALLTEREADEIRSRYSARTLDQLARQTVDLREWFRSALPLVLDDHADLTEVIEHVNELVAHANTYIQLEAVPDGIVVVPTRRWATSAAVLAPVAEAIADLIVSNGHSLIRNCENPTCTLWFYDRTKAHRRRWCSMAVCGNRAKARAHRDRQRTQTATG